MEQLEALEPQVTASRPVMLWSEVRAGLREGWLAAKRNAGPAVLLWLAASAVTAGYFASWQPVRGWLDAIAALKGEWGLWFSMASMCFFGGVIPTVVSALTRKPGEANELRHLPILATFWAWKGIEVDLFYRFQAFLFGQVNDPLTIFSKMVVDMGIYAPLVAVPSLVIFYLFKDSNYSFGKTRQYLHGRWYRSLGLPLLVTDWAVWIPAVSLIYTFPLALQLPIQNLVQCFFSLMILVLTRRAEAKGTATAPDNAV